MAGVGYAETALSGKPDETTVRSVLSAVAQAKGLKLYGELILEYSPDELREVISDLRGGQVPADHPRG